jgi:preprotein translocase subunit SecD
MYLGLDLRGGVHFLLQVDMKGALTKRLDSIGADLRADARQEHSPWRIVREGQTVQSVPRRGMRRQGEAAALAGSQPDLQLATHRTGADFRLVATLNPQAEKRIQEFAVKQNITTLHNRINELGVAEPVIQQQGIDRIVVQLPGVQDTAKAKDILGRTATLEVRMVDDEASANMDIMDQARPRPAAAGNRVLHRARRARPAGQEAGGSDRRTPDGRPGRVRQPDPGTCRASLARLLRRAHLQGRDARERRQAHGHPPHREGQGRRSGHRHPVIRTEIGGGRVQISGRMSTVGSQ